MAILKSQIKRTLDPKQTDLKLIAMMRRAAGGYGDAAQSHEQPRHLLNTRGVCVTAEQNSARKIAHPAHHPRSHNLILPNCKGEIRAFVS